MISTADFHLLSIIFLIIYISYDLIRNRNKERSLLKRLLIYSFIYYILSVIRFTIFPIRLHLLTMDYGSPFQLTPFYFVLESFSRGHLGVTYIQNFIMLIPLGIYLPLLYPKFRSAISVFLGAALLSITIESLQLIMNLVNIGTRVFNVDDVILNTFGAVFGYYIYKLIVKIYKKIRVTDIAKKHL